MYLWKLVAEMHLILVEGKEKVQNFGVTHTSPTTKTVSCPLISIGVVENCNLLITKFILELGC